MRLATVSFLAFSAFLHGWTLDVCAQTTGQETTQPAQEIVEPEPKPAEPQQGMAQPQQETAEPPQETEIPPTNPSEPAVPAPEGCGLLTCGTTASQVFCGECSDGEQCRWDGSNGTAGQCVPNTYGEEVKDIDDDLNPLLTAPTPAPVPTPAPTPPITMVPVATAASKKPTDYKAFAGSSISLRNVASAISVNRNAEPTYNPYYGLSLGFAPRWSFLGKGFVSASFDLDRELTHSDGTTYEGEIVYSDIALAVGAGNFIKLPLDLKLSGDLGITIPVSKYSSARTLQLALKPGLSISRSFSLLGGLSTRYSLRVTKNFHEYTTSQRDVSLIPQCNAAQGDCDRFSNTGVRNASMQISQAMSVGLEFKKGFGAQLSTAVITSFLYPWETNDPRLSYQPQTPTAERHLFAYGLEVYKDVTPALSLSLGLSTINPQLAPDSTYYAPFINRYSALYFDINVDIIEFATHFTRSE